MLAQCAVVHKDSQQHPKPAFPFPRLSPQSFIVAMEMVSELLYQNRAPGPVFFQKCAEGAFGCGIIRESPANMGSDIPKSINEQDKRVGKGKRR